MAKQKPHYGITPLYPGENSSDKQRVDPMLEIAEKESDRIDKIIAYLAEMEKMLKLPAKLSHQDKKAITEPREKTLADLFTAIHLYPAHVNSYEHANKNTVFNTWIVLLNKEQLSEYIATNNWKARYQATVGVSIFFRKNEIQVAFRQTPLLGSVKIKNPPIAFGKHNFRTGLEMLRERMKERKIYNES